jgi:hypothetical protein
MESLKGGKEERNGKDEKNTGWQQQVREFDLHWRVFRDGPTQSVQVV